MDLLRRFYMGLLRQLREHKFLRGWFRKDCFRENWFRGSWLWLRRDDRHFHLVKCDVVWRRRLWRECGLCFWFRFCFAFNLRRRFFGDDDRRRF
jgi:hypothetical protein